jgi:hypothetical protein
MDPERVQSTLRLIGKVYKRVLDDTAQYVIPSAVEMVSLTKEQYDYAKRNLTRGYVPEPWGYTIDHQQPLRFKPKKIPNGIELQPEVYCDIRWMDADIPVKQDIKVRIWCEHAETIYVEDRDSPRILEQLADPKRQYKGRVVSRFHFDKADLTAGHTYHPEYHLQFGGISMGYELCWHPPKVNVPRLNHQPMELFLTCQMIAANFYWEEYQEIKEKREWREGLVYCQELVLRDYYQKCVKLIEDKESLLDGLRAE